MAHLLYTHYTFLLPVRDRFPTLDNSDMVHSRTQIRKTEVQRRTVQVH